VSLAVARDISELHDVNDLHYPRVLAIAGSDSGGGAGIQADLKTFAALGCYGMTAVTAITVQNTVGVQGIHAVPPEMLAGQIDAVLGDIGADAIKIGMLHAPAIVEVVARALQRHGAQQVVLDPVMVAASGDALIEPQTVAVLVRELFARAALITPNLDEAALLLGRPIDGVPALEAAAQALRALGAQAVLLKGGHLPGNTVVDVLATAEGVQRFEAPRIDTRNLHGAGCTLSSAIAAHLALGAPLAAAVAAGRDYTLAALRAGAEVRTGQGRGPLNHGFAPRPLQAR
jgi:hydroxymethylpyrimidine/phosphomethylpyrimidine kinase